MLSPNSAERRVITLRLWWWMLFSNTRFVIRGLATLKAVGRRPPAGRRTRGGRETRAAANMWRPLREALGEIKLTPSERLELVTGSHQVTRIQLLSEEQV